MEIHFKYCKGDLPLFFAPLPCRSGNEEKLMALLTPLNVNCHASDGRKVSLCIFNLLAILSKGELLVFKFTRLF